MTLSRFISGGTSKLFLPGGGFHNMAEFVILFKFIAKDDEKQEWLAWWGASVLYVSLIVICHALPWPLDALWFKFQGLIADTALPIAFLALWRAQHDKRIEFASATVAALLHFSGNIVISIFGGGAIP
ncbi:hypothetical protein M427DRAFT_384886 [Gonapodya prolifera JEL478]|uniref:Uncharacterized protein n=1 Tax=Gonapodya prolifera (strain JEL478) TaxID=1344416 RepID=A0A139A8L9_GONPJ|nr:hypothetical protein M427DRAFT_384886 [Gonapodya prolifera JEL478]|eukprot:KXS13049.1 hypothetical protein M427DRAFT_384886 [Gonapodya prolifera JEL478]